MAAPAGTHAPGLTVIDLIQSGRAHWVKKSQMVPHMACTRCIEVCLYAHVYMCIVHAYTLRVISLDR